MDAYPRHYVEHNLPLVLLSGLGERTEERPEGAAALRQESGTRIVTSSAECTGDRASQLLEQLLRQDGRRQPWNNDAFPGPPGLPKYRIKAIGRTYTLAPRKAAPLPQAPSVDMLDNSQAGQIRNTELHSPLSPLSPGSPIYPDGVFTPLWFAKHQQQVPALLIAFFNISPEADTAQNEQIQIDINAIRTALGRSGFKTRFAAVLMSDKSILHAPELEDRLSAIRRATTMDSKTGLFFMPPISSQVEIATFVQTTLSTLQPLVAEYYRELSKHARRKKGRGGPSPSATPLGDGGAHSLSTPGWNVRYEAKQGAFAEFRQEMDVAERHYSAGIEELFNPEGILEATPSWSPRWNEARLLCDILALRVLRCQLWTGSTTGAAISWVNYKARTKDLVDRRGKGTQTYGWDAWESRWAELMAQLIQHAAVPALQPPTAQGPDDSIELARLQIYAPSEKSYASAERLPPWSLLHHPGYWLKLAFRSASARLDKARAIPEEDRVPPSQSPASAVAQRSKNYDTFLAPQPHIEYPSTIEGAYDHMANLGRLMQRAVRDFSSRGQGRLAERLRYDFAHQIVSLGRHADGLAVLLPLWNETSWRDDDWDGLFGPLVMLLYECATHASNIEICLATAWEILAVKQSPHPLSGVDFAEYLGQSANISEKVEVKFENRRRLSPISVFFAFADKETHAGEPAECQLVLTSSVAEGSTPLTLSRVEIALDDGRVISISHQTDERRSTKPEALTDLSEAFDGGDGSLAVGADLTLQSSQKRIYTFFLTFREAGTVRLRQATIFVETGTFKLEHAFTEEDLMRTGSVYIAHDDVLMRRLLPRVDTTAVSVLPKPPKLRLSIHGLRKQYYTNEQAHLEIEIINEEGETVTASARVSVLGQAAESVKVNWDGHDTDQRDNDIGSLNAEAVSKVALSIAGPPEPSDLTIQIVVTYTLDSDPSTPLVKTITAGLEVAVPFEATHDLKPLLHLDPWPSYFDAGLKSTADDPDGIPQRWRVSTIMHSTSQEPLIIRSTKLVVDSVLNDASCNLLDGPSSGEETLAPGASSQASFELLTRKFSLDDRRPTYIDLSLDVTWSREPDPALVTTTLPVPRMTLPSSEPRVLCTVADTEEGLALQYHLENPSTHFLTFALNMEANDDFAFGGPKYRTLSVAPLSRLSVEYRLLLHEKERKGDGWIWPVLQVVDSYYQKNLRVHSGGPRVKVDEKGALGVRVHV